ncbi:uncharacterized protein MONOS_18148 [Monocercomonoides exilis]|uniref:uncharacterized protein n=1 Tax=Monocercomonoides exilis TaxID=2049356 RepID=UPI003559D054|nr:hypothetical protein MONOS_18148 [Monocercomonoides exilis]
MWAGNTKDRKVLGLYCKVLRHVLYGNAGLRQRVFSRRLAKTLVWLIAPPDASASVEEAEAAAEAEEDVVAALCRLTWQMRGRAVRSLVELGCVAGLVQVLEREPGNGKCRRMAAALGNVLCVGACAVAEECPHPYGAAAEECRAAEVLQKCFEYEEDNQVKRDAARCLLLLSRGRALTKMPDNMVEFCWGVATNTKREEAERANMLSALCLLSLCPGSALSFTCIFDSVLLFLFFFFLCSGLGVWQTTTGAAGRAEQGEMQPAAEGQKPVGAREHGGAGAADNAARRDCDRQLGEQRGRCKSGGAGAVRR